MSMSIRAYGHHLIKRAKDYGYKMFMVTFCKNKKKCCPTIFLRWGPNFLAPKRSPQIFLLIGIPIFVLLRIPCKVSEPYDNPLWDFSNGGNEKDED